MQRLATVFDRRAAHFHEVDFLPREIAQRMRERLDYIKLQPTRVLDAGCGPGADLGPLRARYPQARVVGLDLSARMLKLAQDAAISSITGWRRWLPRAWSMAMSGASDLADLVQGDYARLPFADETFDLLWSNLALQWHRDPTHVFPEWQRVLRTDALLMFSTLGPDTLRELRAAGGPHASLRFVDMHDIGDMLVANGFATPVMDAEMLTVTYPNPQALLRDVRRWGADVARNSRPDAGLGGRVAWTRLLAALEAQRREDGTLALSFEVVYGHAWKAQPKAVSQAQGVIRVEDIGRKSRGRKL